jgi:hypothetical protein
MWDFFKSNPFMVGALTGSLAAYLLGLLVSYLRREKRWLGYSTTSRNIVQQGHSKLSMKYDGREIVRLDSHTILFRNIGNRPLVQLPVRVECASGGEIVERELHAPEGASCAAAADGPGKLVVTTDLLNPGEALNIGLTVANAPEIGVKVIARGEFLEVKQIGESADTAELLEALLPYFPFGGVMFELYRFTRPRPRR